MDQWLPVTAKDHVKEISGEFELSGRQFETVSRSPEKRVFSVAAGTTGEARVRTYYYPHWRAFAGQQELAVRSADDGVLLVSVPAEATTITVEFVEPLRTRVSAIVSTVALLAAVTLIFVGRWRNRQSKLLTV